MTDHEFLKQLYKLEGTQEAVGRLLRRSGDQPQVSKWLKDGNMPDWARRRLDRLKIGILVRTAKKTASVDKKFQLLFEALELAEQRLNSK